MKTCFGYVRVSTTKQGEGVSLTAQREAIQAFADQRALRIVRWFEEKETASKGGRPVFGEMVKALLRGQAQGLVVHKIDRSARNIADWAKIGELSDAGIDIHFATETLDFRSRGGRLTADIQAVIAADYIRNLREETIKGINGRLKQGLYPFKAPLGYVDNGGGKPKTLDPSRAPLVREAFDLYASGQHSLRSLASEMEARGLRTERGRVVARSVLETILTNPFYCGLVRLKRSGAVYSGIHEPLVSRALFEDVQAVRSGRGAKRVTRHCYTYRGLFRCGHCGGAMIPERQKRHVYYRCHQPDCPTKTVREEAIEVAIWETLRRSRLHAVDVEVLESRILAWIEAQDDQRHRLTLTDQLNKARDRLDRLTDALIDSLIDQDTFNIRKESLLVEQGRLEEQLDTLGQDRPSPEQVRWFLELVKNLAATYLIANPSEKRQIVEMTTSNRVVTGKSLDIAPSNWLDQTSSALGGQLGGPVHATSRTNFDVHAASLTRLIANAVAPAFAEHPPKSV